MRLRKPLLQQLNLWATIGLTVAFTLLLVAYIRIDLQIEGVEKLRLNAFLLSDELRQTSDDLTRMARSYVVTGDRLYKVHYQEILDIRDGKKARPVGYEDVYWDLVRADDLRPRPSSGRAVSLLALMHAAGYSKPEFAKLTESKLNSDRLVATELAAMHMVESHDLNSDVAQLKAVRMLYDDNYHRAKAGIMKPIGEALEMVQRRTQADLIKERAIAKRLRAAFITVGVMLLFMYLGLYRHVRLTLGASVDDIKMHIKRLGKGEFTRPVPVPKGMQDSVIGWLAETQNKLSRIEAEQMAAAEEIKNLAFFDTLTGLPNRRLLNDRLNLAMASSKRDGLCAAMLFIDLDNFKPLNDQYGHEAGDMLLREVAVRLKHCMRETDTIARFGGDEFIALIQGLSADKPTARELAHGIAEKIRTALAAPFELDIVRERKADAAVVYRSAASIGGLVFVDHELSRDELFKLADAAMYESKRIGGNSIYFQPLD